MSQEFATEVIELPSKGLLYPESNPLSSGKLTLKYMGAAQEDILTNQSLINDGTVLDEVMKSIIVEKINYDDLLVGDKDGIMVAARILGQGKNYAFTYAGKPYTIDLSTIDAKPLDISLFAKGVNEFKYTTPNTEDKLVWKVLTHADEIKIQKDIAGWKKINPKDSKEVSTRLKYIIIEVNGSRDEKVIRDYIDNSKLIMADSIELRKHIKKVQPGVNLTFFPEGRINAVDIPIGLDFIWAY